MSEEEMTKEEKLEAARKMFAEVKKGKKKGKKAKKNSSAKDTPEPEPKDEPEVEPATVASNDTNTDDKLENNSVDEAEEFKIESEVTDVKLETEQKTENEDQIKETENQNQKEIKEPVSESISSSIEAPNDVDASTNNALIEESTAIQEAPMETESKEEPLESFLSDERASKESSFLTETLQSTIADLTAENDKLTAEVSTLKSDNLNLKLTKMDLEMELENVKNELETQKEQIKRLTQQLAVAKADSIHPIKSNNDDGISVLSGTEYLHHTTSSFQNLTNFNLTNGSQDYMDMVDVKGRLQQWKGWNMDMHGWRSVGMGAVVDV